MVRDRDDRLPMLHLWGVAVGIRERGVAAEAPAWKDALWREGRSGVFGKYSEYFRYNG